MRFVVVYGSVRTARQGIRAARYVVRRLGDRGHAVTLLDPLELRLPLLDLMYKEYPAGRAPAPLETIAAALRAADGFVIVTGEYNHGVPPALSNLLDHFLEQWFWRPSAIVCYSGGAFGGVRAAVHLRAMLGELGMPSIPSLFPVPEVQHAFAEDGAPLRPSLDARLARFLDELEWYARALAEARRGGTPY
ncbi:MAG TPA: NADPH-dependent FMN reductase [Candidatus Binatia bacterium]|nr:NADPH-dependent FMN reductase [Candidatus Binatia bacterium]